MGKELLSNFKRIYPLKLSKLLFLLLILAPVFAISQPSSSNIESNYREAQADYDNGYYVDSNRKFAALADSFPDDPRNSVFRFMAAKSLYKTGDYRDAAILWNEFIAAYPTSSLLGAAHLFNAHSHFLQNDFLTSAMEYIKVIDFAPKSEEALLAKENLNPLILRGLTIDELRQLIDNNPGSSTLEDMEYAMGSREIGLGHYRKGAGLLKAFIARYPGSRQFKQAKLMLSEAEQKLQNQIVIGLLAPVTGVYQEYGKSMVEAAQLAIKLNNMTTTKIELEINDTEGDPIIAARSASALAQEEPVGVVGPLRSESAISAAIILNERNIPMITPTASQSGLAAIGPNIFQISPPGEIIAKTVAHYAAKNLKISDFAIIAPDDNEGTHIANSFAQAVYECGGEIIQTTYYPSDATDFKQYIMPLREILLAKTEERLNSGKVDSADFEDTKYSGILPKEDWHVKLGGLFLPGSLDDLKLIIPQVKYNGINTRFLGSDNWDSPGLMREVKNYVDNAVFAADYHPNPKDQAWFKFERAYQAEYHRAPDKVAALTYDAVNLMLDGISSGHTTPEDLRGFLNGIDNYQGVSAVVSFKNSNRANDEVGVYSIDGKRLNK